MTLFPDTRPPAGNSDPLARGGRPPRVLIAEDNPGMREMLTVLVTGLGYDAVAVSDGRAALSAVAAAAPDLLLSDVAMPGFNGLEVCRTLRRREQTSRIRIIMLTVRSDETDKVLALEMGLGRK